MEVELAGVEPASKPGITPLSTCLSAFDFRPAGCRTMATCRLSPVDLGSRYGTLRLPTHHAMLPYRRRVSRSPGNSRIWLIGLIKQPTRSWCCQLIFESRD